MAAQIILFNIFAATTFANFRMFSAKNPPYPKSENRFEEF